jgi:hypothetical protein
MDLWIYSEDFVAQGIVDTASSIIWANRHRQCGDFEIYVSASAEMLDLLQSDRFVVRPDDDMVGIIECVRIETNEETGDYLLATGRCARSILARRIIWDQTTLDGTTENGMRRLITDALISPTIPARRYDRLRLAPAHGYTDRTTAQYTGDNLLEAVEGLCAAKNYGFRIFRDEGNNLALDFYKGVDRSMSQSERPRVLFSAEYDNLRATAYTLDKQGYKTVALVAGEGEGTARRRTTVSRAVDQEGLHRRELYVDARDVSSNEGEITDSEYMAQLAERGDTGLSEAPIVQSMEGEIVPGQMHTYKQDYFLGDIVTVMDKYGVQADTQVLEVVEVWDENGYTCTPTFG